MTLSQLPCLEALTKSGMTFSPAMPQRAWEEIGSQLRELASSSAWWMGDWLLFGENAYSGRYREAVGRTGLDYQTLRNYAWVARRFEQHRRRDALSFAHHAEVARLARPEQDYWLRRAEEQRWSRNELRRQLRAGLAEQHGGAAAEPAGEEATLRIALPKPDLDRLLETAAACGLSLNEWAAHVLQSAVSTGTRPGLPAPAAPA
ncbi:MULTISPECIES: LmbU family transcriptional regulator [Streptomyces]|uniref:LmbU family transcriptional regulator n=1 Tax=Streptomyces TaxID=1883 RepID=UPI0022B2750D|nr:MULTISPECIES: LmbU family transcriptional regulator [Streptomyces]